MTQRPPMMLAVFLLTSSLALPPLSAQSSPSASDLSFQRQQAMRRIIAPLKGALPDAFDLAPSDPCSGAWTINDANGSMNVVVMRYKHVPMVHAKLNGVGENELWERLGAHTVGFALGRVSYKMQCGTSGGSVEEDFREDGEYRHKIYRVLSAIPEM